MIIGWYANHSAVDSVVTNTLLLQQQRQREIQYTLCVSSLDLLFFVYLSSMLHINAAISVIHIYYYKYVDFFSNCFFFHTDCKYNTIILQLCHYIEIINCKSYHDKIERIIEIFTFKNTDHTKLYTNRTVTLGNVNITHRRAEM